MEVVKNSAESDWLSEDALMQQGAEARVYAVLYAGRPAIVKERFSKKYRHPQLDAKLTERRTNAEIRCMMKCRRMGVNTPVVWFVDKFHHRIVMERIDGVTVKEHLTNFDLATELEDARIQKLARDIGQAISKIHDAGVVHGDLTTSNLMIRPSGQLVCIDFGLSYQSTLSEDRAVDLYVLQRALVSTHPSSDGLFNVMMKEYGRSAQGTQTVRRLADVRLRGRKRDMTG